VRVYPSLLCWFLRIHDILMQPKHPAVVLVFENFKEFQARLRYYENPGIFELAFQRLVKLLPNTQHVTARPTSSSSTSTTATSLLPAGLRTFYHGDISGICSVFLSDNLWCIPSLLSHRSIRPGAQRVVSGLAGRIHTILSDPAGIFWLGLLSTCNTFQVGVSGRNRRVLGRHSIGVTKGEVGHEF
jgi:hypothetical protein